MFHVFSSVLFTLLDKIGIKTGAVECIPLECFLCGGNRENQVKARKCTLGYY